MNKLFSLFILSLFLMTSCLEEVGPEIDFAVNVEEVEQLSEIPAHQPKKVFLAEFSGGKCNNCPLGAAEVVRLLEEYPDELISCAMHSAAEEIFAPAEGAIFDFRTEQGFELFLSFGGNAIPAATTDYHAFEGNNSVILPNLSAWEGAIAERVSLSSPVNLNLNNNFHADSDSLTMTFEIDYTEDVTVDNNITVLIIENHIIDAQLMPDNSTNPAYEHNHIVRSFVTPALGNTIANGANKVAGTRVTRIFGTHVSPDWNLANCEVIGIVHQTGAVLDCYTAIEEHLLD